MSLLVLAGCAGTGSQHARAGLSANAYTFTSGRDGNPEIYLGSLVGPEVQRLTNDPSPDTAGPISPDGTKVLFSTQRDGNEEVYVMNIDGTNQINLTNDPGPDNWPSWSPDGTKILFSSGRNTNYALYVMNADGSNPVSLAPQGAQDIAGCFSPDGTKIAFISFSPNNADFSIWRMNADGTNREQLVGGSQSVATFPVYSPDGTQITYMQMDQDGIQIWRMSSDGQNRIQLTTADTNIYPSWTADGTKIVFAKFAGDNPGQIWEMNAQDGSALVNVSQSSTDEDHPRCYNPTP